MERRLMANAEKTAVIEELASKFQNSGGAVLTEYRGLTVAQLRELRGSLSGNPTFHVTKNTLAKVAATQAGVGEPAAPVLARPSALTRLTRDAAWPPRRLLHFP